MNTNSGPYIRSGNPTTTSEQAESSNFNPIAGTTQMRILVELQLISMLLHQGFGISDDLPRLRRDVAASIT